MENTITIAGLIGFIMPLVIALVKQCGLNRYWNFAIAAVVCAIAGLITVAVRGELQWGNAVAAMTAVFVSAQAFYGAFWKDSGLELYIAEKTSFIKTCEPPT